MMMRAKMATTMTNDGDDDDDDDVDGEDNDDDEGDDDGDDDDGDDDGDADDDDYEQAYLFLSSGPQLCLCLVAGRRSHLTASSNRRQRPAGSLSRSSMPPSLA